MFVGELSMSFLAFLGMVRFRAGGIVFGFLEQEHSAVGLDRSSISWGFC